MSSNRESAVNERYPDVTYRKPPLSETSLGVEFPPIPGWNISHFGLFYLSARARYSIFEGASPVIVASGKPAFGMTFNVGAPKVRGILSNDKRSRLIQVQDDLFYANWQKTDDDSYPRYRELLPRFMEEWKYFTAFLEDAGLDSAQPSRCQLTYINVIERNPQAGQSLLISDLYTAWRSDAPMSENVSGVSFSISHNVNAVEILATLQPALRMSDGQTVLQYSLTSSTRDADLMAKPLDSILDTLHSTVVSAFEAFTSDRAKAEWERA